MPPGSHQSAIKNPKIFYAFCLFSILQSQFRDESPDSDNDRFHLSWHSPIYGKGKIVVRNGIIGVSVLRTWGAISPKLVEVGKNMQISLKIRVCLEFLELSGEKAL